MKGKQTLQCSLKTENIVYLKLRMQYENRSLSNLVDTILDLIREADDTDFMSSGRVEFPQNGEKSNVSRNWDDVIVPDYSKMETKNTETI